MPRPLRIHLPGGFYHATLRGNHQQDIFRNAADRVRLEHIVGRALATYDARLHAYCWMTNHLHFLVQPASEPLGSLMRQIASEYARVFQKTLGTTGHLFERRYHAKLVLDDSYLLTALRYIHRNPLEAGLARSLAEYVWSSHRAYAGGACPPWLTTDFMLRLFAAERAAAVAGYRKFVEVDKFEPDAADAVPARPFAAESRFLTSQPLQIEVPGARLTLDALIDEACHRFETTRAQLHSGCRDVYLTQVRAWITHQALSRRVANLSEIARALQRDRATLRHAMQRYPDQLE